MINLSLGLSKNDRQFRSAIKNILGFAPQNLALYKQSFRHNSVAREIKEGVKDSNERLEFLGDSVLNTVIAEYLFRKFPYEDEGFLTKMRSKIVSRAQLNQLALKLGLNKLLLQSRDPGLKFSSMYGNAFEALIGAIYVDKGFLTAQKFIINRILRYHIDIDKTLLTETDFKSKIIEWSQQEKQNVQFKMMGEKGNGYDKKFLIAVLVNSEIIAQAQHYSKRKAEQLSAEFACAKLGIE